MGQQQQMELEAQDDVSAIVSIAKVSVAVLSRAIVRRLMRKAVLAMAVLTRCSTTCTALCRASRAWRAR